MSAYKFKSMRRIGVQRESHEAASCLLWRFDVQAFGVGDGYALSNPSLSLLTTSVRTLTTISSLKLIE